MFLFGNFRYQKVIESCALQPDIDMLPAGDAEVNMFLLGNFRYQKVIESCALQPDIDMLPAGDATEIGEKVLRT